MQCTISFGRRSSVWVQDFGPLFLVDTQPTIVDFEYYYPNRGLENLVPAAFAARSGVPLDHSDLALGEADGTSPWPAREYLEPPSEPRLPLEGLRVVDLTALGRLAATHLLAAFGADVVKVESIQRPDGIRYSGGMRKDVDDWWEYGWVFHAMNTNKR